MYITLLCHLHLIYWKYILCVCGVDECILGIPRLADALLTMEQEKSLVTTGAHNESETTALLVHIDAPSHTTQTATTTTTTATSAVEARVTTM